MLQVSDNKITSAFKQEKTLVIKHFWYFNVLYRWPDAQWMASFIETAANRNNRFYMLSKLTEDDNQIGVGNFCHCIQNSFPEYHSSVVWITTGVPFNHAPYLIAHRINIWRAGGNSWEWHCHESFWPSIIVLYGLYGMVHRILEKHMGSYLLQK